MAENDRPKGEARLLVALAGGATIRDAAKMAGIGERTAYRRLDDAEFRQQVAVARSRMVDHAVGQLAGAACEAATTLRGLLRSEAEPIRLAAARAILDLGPKLRESHELADRLDGVEKTVIVVKQTPDFFNRLRCSDDAAAPY